MEVVRARLGGHVDLTRLSAEFRRIDPRLHLELLQRIDRRHEDVGVEIDVGVVDPIQREVVELATLTRDRELLDASSATLTGSGLTWTCEVGADVRAQGHQLQIVPAIERQFHDSFVLDHRSDRGAFGREQRRKRGDLHRLLESTELEGEVETGGLLDLQNHVLRDRPKSLQLHLHLVRTRLQNWKTVHAGAVAWNGAKGVCRLVAHGDRGAREHSASRISDDAGDLARRLRETGRTDEQPNKNRSCGFRSGGHGLLLVSRP